MTRTKSVKKTSSNSIYKKPPPPTPKNIESPSFMGQMLSTMSQGVAFGAGSSIAHQSLDGILGNKETETHSENNYKKCQHLIHSYRDCLLKEFNTNLCDIIIENLDDCMKNKN